MAHLRHEHLIVRAEVLYPPQKNQIDEMNTWFHDLVNRIGMKILMGPFTVYSDIVGNRGFSGVCIIETSHIALHVWDEDSPSMFQLDVYTCSDVNVETVIDCLKVFEPVNIEFIYIDREKKLDILEQKIWSPKTR